MYLLFYFYDVTCKEISETGNVPSDKFWINCHLMSDHFSSYVCALYRYPLGYISPDLLKLDLMRMLP